MTENLFKFGDFVDVAYRDGAKVRGMIIGTGKGEGVYKVKIGWSGGAIHIVHKDQLSKVIYNNSQQSIEETSLKETNPQGKHYLAGVFKETNPKAINGSQKLNLSLWPGIATAYGALCLENGGLRYGYGNYKNSPVSMSTYLAATLRHAYAVIEGQEFDEIDGTPHLGAILANVAIILEARAVGTLVDDRPCEGGYLKEIKQLTAIANNLKEMHKDKNPVHFYRKTDNDK